MNRGGFSWKRLTGVSAAKGRLSRKIGVPLTRSGRQRKLGKMLSCGGCLLSAGLLSVSAGILAYRVTARMMGGYRGRSDCQGQRPE